MLAFLHQMLIQVIDLYDRLTPCRNTTRLDGITNVLLDVRERKCPLDVTTTFGAIVGVLLVAGTVMVEALVVKNMPTGQDAGGFLHDL